MHGAIHDAGKFDDDGVRDRSHIMTIECSHREPDHPRTSDKILIGIANKITEAHELMQYPMHGRLGQTGFCEHIYESSSIDRSSKNCQRPLPYCYTLLCL